MMEKPYSVLFEALVFAAIFYEKISYFLEYVNKAGRLCVPAKVADYRILSISYGVPFPVLKALPQNSTGLDK
jgi:hypothetical protein